MNEIFLIISIRQGGEMLTELVQDWTFQFEFDNIDASFLTH